MIAQSPFQNYHPRRMKLLSTAAVSIALLGLLSAPLPAQDVHSAFGSRAANTQQDLMRMIVINPYTWVAGDAKAKVTFKADGTGKQSFFEFTWDVKTPQQIEIFATEGGKSTTITFDNSYSSFTGTDFDGHPFHGEVDAPKATPTPKPVAVPTPAIAASGTTTPGVNASAPKNTPSASTVTVATPTPAKASGDFFKNLQTGGGNYNTTASSSSDLAAALIGKTYNGFLGSRGGTVKFNADGTASSNFSGYKKMAWKVRSAHEIEIWANGKDAERKVIMHFTGDMQKYNGTENYGDYDYAFKGELEQ